MAWFQMVKNVWKFPETQGMALHLTPQGAIVPSEGLDFFLRFPSLKISQNLVKFNCDVTWVVEEFGFIPGYFREILVNDQEKSNNCGGD